MVDVNPYLVNGTDDLGSPLQPLPAKEKAFQEGWLQELLFKHPKILPVDYIDESFAPLISLGREIANIDNLFISPTGLLTIVETKLWRNPEAHRTVVAQVLEYAKTLSTWTYNDLESAVMSFQSRRMGTPASIYEIVKAAHRNLDIGDIDFQARVQSCLTNGRFALLIVGDRIYPEATQLAEVIQSAPHLQFSMGFVELRCYRLDKNANWPLVVVPNFLSKTMEYTRAVVKIFYEEKKPDVLVEAVEIDKNRPSSRTNIQEFLASLPSNVRDSYRTFLESWMRTPGYTVYWGQVGFSLRVPIEGKLTTIFEAYPTNTSITSDKWAKKYNFPGKSYDKYRIELMKSSVLGSAIAAGRRYLEYSDLNADDIMLLLSSTDKFATDISEVKTDSK